MMANISEFSEIQVASAGIPLKEAKVNRCIPDAISPAVLADWRWAFEQRNLGNFASYAQNHVAVAKQAVQAVGPNPQDLEREVAKRLGITEADVVVVYVD